MKRAAMRRILFVLAVVGVMAIMTTPPIAAQPLLTSRPPPIGNWRRTRRIGNVGDEVLEIAEEAMLMVDWLFGSDDGNDADTPSNDANTSESSARMG
jgi:hypothetical protein